MNFELTEERQMMQDSLRRFLRDRYTTEERNRIVASEAGYSPQIWADLADLGIIGALFTEEQGGFGGDGFDIACVFEELGRAGVVEPLLETGILAGGLLADLGHDQLLEAVVAGQTQLAFAHSEPTSRYDLSHVETTANTSGETITLSGRKAVVQNAEAADHFVISAREGGTIRDENGISLFLLSKDSPGLTLMGYPLMGGGRAAEIVMDQVKIPATARLSPPGEAYPIIERRHAMAIVAASAEALGAMETAVALTIAYLGQRTQFGRPIGTFQVLQHRVADLLIELEQVRSITILAAGHLNDQREIRERYVSAAKNLVGRVGRLVAEECIQMHGGIAMTEEYALAHFAKRIVLADHRLGDTDHHLERFIALTAS